MKNMKEVFDVCNGYVMEDNTQKGKYFVYEFTMGDFGYLDSFEEEEVKVLETLKIGRKNVVILENVYGIDYSNEELFDNLEMALNEF